MKQCEIRRVITGGWVVALSYSTGFGLIEHRAHTRTFPGAWIRARLMLRAFDLRRVYPVRTRP